MVSNAFGRLKKKLEGYPVILEVISMFLLVGTVYFAVKGSMVLAFHNTSPMMGVRLDSMTHPTSVWRQYYDNSSELPFQEGIQPGDLVLVRGVDTIEEVQIGDVIVWERNDGKRIIHRVDVKSRDENGIYLKTRSDKYAEYGPDHQKIRSGDIVGKAIFSVPYLGYPSTLL